jgi:hypothetical protein
MAERPGPLARAAAALDDALDRQAARVAPALLPFYRRYPYRGPLGLFKVDPRGAYSPVDGFFYNRIPKAANSTVMATLMARSTFSRAFSDGHAKRRLLRPSRLLPRDVARFEHDVFKFTFVRDPYARVLSAFADKILRRRQQSRGFYASRGGDDGTPPAFIDFLRFLEDGALLADPHWTPQVHLMLLPLDRFDFIGRVERLDADLAHVMGRVFPDAPPAPPKRAGPRTDSRKRYDEAYTPEARALVERLYREDFAALGYPMARPEGQEA